MEGSGHRVSRYRSFARALLLAPIAFVGVFVVVPTLVALRHGFDITEITTNDSLRRVVWFTFWQAALCTLLTITIGIPIASLVSRREFRGRRGLRALTLVPFVLPTVVVGLAFRALFPGELRMGLLPLVVAHVFLNVAVVVRVVGARWEMQPFGFEEAAATLGARPIVRFATVTWPMLRGAVMAAGGLVFMYCFTTFGAARVLAGPTHPTTETEIYRLAVLTGDVRSAAVLAVAQIIIVGVVLALTSGRRAHGVASAAPRPLRHAAVRTRYVVVSSAIACATVFALPLVGLATRSLRVGDRYSLRGWKEALHSTTTSADIVGAVESSLRVAAFATLIATVVGFALSFARVHGRGATTSGVALVCEALPVIVSAVVVGLGFILAFRNGPFDWRGAWWLLPVAHAVVALPLVARTITSAMRQIPDDLRNAAATLGSSPLRTLVNVDVALLRRPIAAAASLGALVSLGEFGASSLLTRRGSETLTMTLGRLLGRPGDVMQTQAFVTATVLGVLCLVLVWAVDALAGKGVTR